jgi:hypothetical protein
VRDVGTKTRPAVGADVPHKLKPGVKEKRRAAMKPLLGISGWQAKSQIMYSSSADSTFLASLAN